MCGILFSARLIKAGKDKDFTDLFRNLQVSNSARGPDAQGLHNVSLPRPHNSINSIDGNIALDFFASELRLRGDISVVQPHQAGGDVLCWNGEIFEGMNISPQENDGVRLFDKLRAAETAKQIRDLFGSIEGPYAFIYYQSASQRLFFARDPLGRRSLLVHNATSFPCLIFASVSTIMDPRYQFEEISTNHIYYLDFSQVSGEELSQQGYRFTSHLTSLPRQSSDPNISAYAEPTKVNRELPPSNEFPLAGSLETVPDYLVGVIDNFIDHLDRSVMLRVRDIPLSIPSAVKGQARVAVLFSGGIDSTVIAFLAHRHIPINEPIDLLNVAFENPMKIKGRKEGNLNGLPKKQRKKQGKSQSPVGHSIDAIFMVPDRQTGLQEVEELRELCPARAWNFVEINVPYEESKNARQEIELLMLPSRTVMDMSLALALYFASRGKGQIRLSNDSKPVPYTSSARVLLNGFGADELLGGYSRHRSTFHKGGWESVIDELQSEIDRIPTRNLGRDDRVVSSHGKEIRHPFLSLTLLDFLVRLPVHFKMDPRLEAGVGDKLLLRLAARKMGLIDASQRRKRAMQFGSHSARMEGEKRGDALLD